MRGVRRPPRVEAGRHGRRDPGCEVVAGGRRRESCPPTEGVGRDVRPPDVGLDRGQRDRRDVVGHAIERRAADEVEGRADEEEVVGAHGQVASPEVVLAEGGRTLEVSRAARRLDGVQGIGGVDGAVGTLGRLARVVELRPPSGMHSVLSGIGRAEHGEHRPGRADGSDVAVRRVQQVAVGLGRHPPVAVDEGEGTGDPARRRVEHITVGTVLDDAHHYFESCPRPDREEAGRVARLGVARPQHLARGGELGHLRSVVARQIDVARRIDDRLAHLVGAGEPGGKGERADEGAREGIGVELAAGVDVDGTGGGEEVDHAPGRHHDGRNGIGREGRFRPEDGRRVGGLADGADLGRRRGRHRTGDLRRCGLGAGDVGYDSKSRGQSDHPRQGADNGPSKAGPLRPARCPLHPSSSAGPTSSLVGSAAPGLAGWPVAGAPARCRVGHLGHSTLPRWSDLRWLRRVRAPFILTSAQNIEKAYPPPFRWLERWSLTRAAGAYTCNSKAAQAYSWPAWPGPRWSCTGRRRPAISRRGSDGPRSVRRLRLLHVDGTAPVEVEPVGRQPAACPR